MGVKDRLPRGAEEQSDLELARREIAELRKQLLEAEQRLAGLPALKERSAELDRILGSRSWRLRELAATLARPLRRLAEAFRGTTLGRIGVRLRRMDRD